MINGRLVLFFVQCSDSAGFGCLVCCFVGFFLNESLVHITIPSPQQIVRSCFHLVFRYLRSTQHCSILPCISRFGMLMHFPCCS